MYYGHEHTTWLVFIFFALLTFFSSLVGMLTMCRVHPPPLLLLATPLPLPPLCLVLPRWDGRPFLFLPSPSSPLPSPSELLSSELEEWTSLLCCKFREIPRPLPLPLLPRPLVGVLVTFSTTGVLVLDPLESSLLELSLLLSEELPELGVNLEELELDELLLDSLSVSITYSFMGLAVREALSCSICMEASDSELEQYYIRGHDTETIKLEQFGGVK